MIDNDYGVCPDDRITTPTTIGTKRSPASSDTQSGGIIQLEWNCTGSLLLVRWGVCVFVTARRAVVVRVTQILTNRLPCYFICHESNNRTEHTSESIHIYSFPRAPAAAEFKPLLRTVIQHRTGIINARWNPVRSGSLVLCTMGSGALYLWQDSNSDWTNDAEVAECVGIPGSQSPPLFYFIE